MWDIYTHIFEGVRSPKKIKIFSGWYTQEEGTSERDANSVDY